MNIAKDNITPLQYGYLQLFNKIYKEVGIDMLKMEFMRVVTPEQFQKVAESIFNNYDLPGMHTNKNRAS